MTETEILGELQERIQDVEKLLNSSHADYSNEYEILRNQVCIMEALTLSLQQQEEILNRVKNISTYNPNNIK